MSKLELQVKIEGIINLINKTMHMRIIDMSEILSKEKKTTDFELSAQTH